MWVIGIITGECFESGHLNRFENLFIDVCERAMEEKRMDLSPNHFKAVNFEQAEEDLLADKYNVNFVEAKIIEDFSKASIIPVNFFKSRYLELARNRFTFIRLSICYINNG